MKSEYLVVLPIEKMSVGDAYPQSTSLPLHLTVMPWFRVDSEVNLIHLRNQLMLLACGVKKLELVSVKPQAFGPNMDILVHVLRQNEELRLLHTELLVFLARMNSAPKDLQWVGAGYCPHVTHTDTSNLFIPGSHHTSEHLVLVERGEDRAKVVKSRYKLGDIPF